MVARPHRRRIADGDARHPFTGVWTIILLAALAVHRRLWRPETLLPLSITLACVAVLLAVWPYYSFFELLRGGEHAEPSTLYSGIPWRLCATLPGLLVIAQRFRRDRTDPLALMLFGAGVVYVLGAVTNDYNLGRLLPLVLLPCTSVSVSSSPRASNETIVLMRQSSAGSSSRV